MLVCKLARERISENKKTATQLANRLCSSFGKKREREKKTFGLKNLNELTARKSKLKGLVTRCTAFSNCENGQ